MPYTPEQIKSRYDKLPADIKEAMDSVDTTNAVVDVGQKYDLLYDQISELVDEVGLTMIGITPETRFVTNIARRMQIDMGKAMLIAQDINKAVFDKMRDSLKKIEGGTGKDDYDKGDDLTTGKSQFGQGATLQEGEKTMMTDAEIAQKDSVVSAIEKAGGFVIDKPNKKSAVEISAEKPESKREIINILELDSAMPPDHLLGDTPEKKDAVSQTGVQSEASGYIDKTPDSRLRVNDKADQSSIVDTLLSKGVAMSLDTAIDQKATGAEKKVRPYDGTDPYREAV